MKITQERRDQMFRVLSSDVPVLTSMAKTQALHEFSRTQVHPVIERAVHDYADHLEKLATEAPEFADAIGEVFDHEGLTDSGYMDEPLRMVMEWLHDHAA